MATFCTLPMATRPLRYKQPHLSPKDAISGLVRHCQRRSSCLPYLQTKNVVARTPVLVVKVTSARHPSAVRILQYATRSSNRCGRTPLIACIDSTTKPFSRETRCRHFPLQRELWNVVYRHELAKLEGCLSPYIGNRMRKPPDYWYMYTECRQECGSKYSEKSTVLCLFRHGLFRTS